MAETAPGGTAGGEPGPRLRVACYVTRESATGGTELLVFDHAKIPAAGTQVPAGGVEPGERLADAAVREVREETGLAGPELARVVGVRDSVQRGVPGGPVHRHTWFVHLRVAAGRSGRRTASHWRHTVRSAGADDGMVFDCRFVPLPLPFGLADGQDELLGELAPARGTAAQDRLDTAYRSRFRADPRVAAACAYGSRPAGLDDGYSDVEYWVFVADDAVAAYDRAEWVGAVGEPGLVVRTEFGGWVAVHPGLLRAEVHVQPASGIDVVAGWPGRGAAVDDMVVVDRDGRLRTILGALPLDVPVPADPAAVAELCGRFGNWWTLGWNVLGRGEVERACDALGQARRCLTWMLRRDVGATARWLTPSRLAEADMPAAALAALARLRPSDDPGELRRSYDAGWRSAEPVWTRLAASWGFAVPAGFFADVRSRLAASP